MNLFKKETNHTCFPPSTSSSAAEGSTSRTYWPWGELRRIWERRGSPCCRRGWGSCWRCWAAGQERGAAHLCPHFGWWRREEGKMQGEWGEGRWWRADPFTVLLCFLQMDPLPLSWFRQIFQKIADFCFCHRPLGTVFWYLPYQVDSLVTLVPNWVFSNARVFITASFDEYTMRRGFRSKRRFLAAAQRQNGVLPGLCINTCRNENATQLSQVHLSNRLSSVMFLIYQTMS